MFVIGTGESCVTSMYHEHGQVVLIFNPYHVQAHGHVMLNFPYSTPEEISNVGPALFRFIPPKSGLVGTNKHVSRPQAVRNKTGAAWIQAGYNS